MKTQTHKFRRTAISVVISVLLGQQAIAAEQQKKQTEDAEEVERIVVTGSNIRRGSANFSSSAPITELTDETIEGVGSISVEDVLNRIPSITSELSASSNNISVGGFASNVGVATTSLRNLGAARTLVLVNGRRYVSGVSANSGYGVDLNSIATSTIERVDVLTGGQSAIYGSDAIAGVINIITKSSFDGFEFNAMSSDSTEGGAAKQNVDFTYGKNFDAGNAWVSVGYANQESLTSPERDFAANELRFIDTDGDGIQESIAVRNGPSHVDGAALFAGDVKVFGNGSPFNTNQPVLDGNYNRLGDTDFDNQHSGRYIVSPYSRFNFASGLTFDVSDNSFAQIEINYSQTEAKTHLEEAPLDVVNNVFRKGAGGTTGIDVATSPYFVGSSAGEQLLDELIRLGNGTSLDNVQTARRLWEFGDRIVTNHRDTFRIAGSYTYDFENDFSLKTSAVYGVTSQQQNNGGDVSLTQIRNAVTIESDGNGGYQCADAAARIEGCVPVNPFSTVDSLAGQAGIVGFSDEAIDYIKISTGQTGKIEQTVLNSTLSGAFSFDLIPDDVGFAIGMEYRKEEAEEVPDSFRQLGLARDAAIEPIKGEFDVIEVFSEFHIPVAEWLNVSLSGRIADYSTVGSTSTYRLGLDAPVTNSIRIRASQSSSVRAPNINDLFSIGSTSVAGVDTDICNGTTNSASDNISVNCASISAIGDRMAADPNGAFVLVGSEANNTSLRSTGNPELKEETADSLTLGAVFTPTESLSVSVDYYDIQIEDGIAQVTPAVFVERCHNVAPSEFDPTCGGNLIRDINDGPILHLNSALINADTITTSGLDVDVSYMIGDLKLNFLTNLLDKYSVETTTGTEEFVGRPQFPEYRFTVNGSYNISDSLNVFGQFRHRAETQAYLDETSLSDDLNMLDAVSYLDLRVNYQLSDSFSAYVGSNNVFDQQPDILPRGAAAGTNTEPRAYDVIGRQIFAGLKVKF